MDLNPKFVFDTFVVGPSNELAHASALSVAHNPGRYYNPLYIHSDIGLGKTHLMQAIGHYARSHHHANVCYRSCEKIWDEYCSRRKSRDIEDLRRQYTSVDVFLLDDISLLQNAEGLQDVILHLFDLLYHDRKQIVLACACYAPNEIPGLKPALLSRFEWGMVTEIGPPDFETLMAVLLSKQEHLHISLPEEVLTFMASNITKNYRRLEGALVRIDAYARLSGEDITLDLARRLLKNTLELES